MKRRSSYSLSWESFFTAHLNYWEGILVFAVFGIKWAIIWFAAWALLGAGVRIGRSV